MNIACLAPTFGRPRAVLENSIACFMAQGYPAHKRRLLLYDDLGNIGSQVGPSWEVCSTTTRAPSLSIKYDMMVEYLGDWPDLLVVWDDDDLYLPWHLDGYACAVEGADAWVHPWEVYSTYAQPAGQCGREAASGRFHGSLGVTPNLAAQVGGWGGVVPLDNPRCADFDQRFIAALAQRAMPSRPAAGTPSYVFRWGDSGASHCQSRMRTPSDETWYLGAVPDYSGPADNLQPVWDSGALALLKSLGIEP